MQSVPPKVSGGFEQRQNPPETLGGTDISLYCQLVLLLSRHRLLIQLSN
jgi:hypothetical protein